MLQYSFLRVLIAPEALLWCKYTLAGSAHYSCIRLYSVSASCRGDGCAAQQCSSHWQKTLLSVWVTLPIPNNHWKLESVTGINSPYSCIWRLSFFKCVSPLLSNLQAFLTQQDLCRGRNIELLCGGTGFCFKAHCWYTLKYSSCSHLDTGWVYYAWFFSEGAENPIICLPTDLLISYLMLPSYYLLISFRILRLHSYLTLDPSETWKHDAVSQATFGNGLFVDETNDIRWNKELQGLTLTYLHFSNIQNRHIEFLRCTVI